MYPPIGEALEEAGLYPMKEYLTRRRNRMIDYVATQPIFDMCGAVERQPGSLNRQRWWDPEEE